MSGRPAAGAPSFTGFACTAAGSPFIWGASLCSTGRATPRASELAPMSRASPATPLAPDRAPALQESEEPLLGSPEAHAWPVPKAHPLEQRGVPVSHAEASPERCAPALVSLVRTTLGQLAPEVPLSAVAAPSQRARSKSPLALLGVPVPQGPAVPGVLVPANAGGTDVAWAGGTPPAAT